MFKLSNLTVAPLNNSANSKPLLPPYTCVRACTCTHTHSLFSTLQSVVEHISPSLKTPGHRLRNSSSYFETLAQLSYFKIAICIYLVFSICDMFYFSKMATTIPRSHMHLSHGEVESMFPLLRSRWACDNGRSDTTWLSKLDYTRQYSFCLVLLGNLLLEPSHHTVKKPRPRGKGTCRCPAKVQPTAGITCQTCE